MTASNAAQVAEKATKFEVKSPLNGEVLSTLPVHTAEDVNAAVERARQAFEVWGQLSFAQRREHLLDYRRELVRRLDEIIETVHLENGKPKADVSAEMVLVTSHLTHCADRAEQVFRTRRVPAGMMANYRATISYHPYGVVGVIGPWNFPLFTPMGSIAYALSAGNTVVFKPSELTPLTGRLLVECAQAAIPIPNVLQLVTGMGETGAALARAKIDKLAFTGSPATGRRVMAAAAENLTPVVLELGGKDPLLVAEDADVPKAAKAAVYGALINSGQACISVERAYVAEPVYSEFVERVVEEARGIRVGAGDDAHYGAMTLEKQIDIVRDQVDDALKKGAKAVLGGLDSFKGRFIEPIVLVDVTNDMKIMQEETFGPVLPIVRVASLDEALKQANETSYGLGSAIFGKRGVHRIADKLRAGATAINSVISFAGIPSLPFGGVRESGFGRIHGDHGMREFAMVKATAEERMAIPGLGFAFGAPDKQNEQNKGMIRALFGGSALDDVRGAINGARGRVRKVLRR